MLVMEIGGLDRDSLAADLRNAGWDCGEIAAVVNHLKATYDDENEYEYTSDLRVARESVPEEVASYHRVAADGCCGDYDEAIEAVRTDGTKSRLMVGFNFGH